jgi:Protein of unknown function (DUF4232)
MAQLKVTAVRGGALPGREIAGVLFTNSGTTTCSVRGYIFAQLRYRGAALGDPATDNPGPVRTVVLRRNASAQAQLTAVSTCQAPISDHVQVRLPGAQQSATAVMQLRGCSLSVDPLTGS